MPSDKGQDRTHEIVVRVVLVSFILQLLLNMLCWGALVGWSWHQQSELQRLEREHKLLEDYTEGRIDHMPYRPERSEP